MDFNNRQQQPSIYSYPPFRPPPAIPSSNPSSRVGIKVALKPEYRLAPPPQLLPLLEEIPHSSFQFDFDQERKVLENAEKEGQGVNGPARRPSSLVRMAEAAAPAPVEDPIVLKYTSMGLNREAVVLATATYGDVQTKVIEFVASYDVMREMGFEPDKIAGVLAMFDNDRELASAHLLG